MLASGCSFHNTGSANKNLVTVGQYCVVRFEGTSFNKGDNGGNFTYQITISNSSTGADKVLISNFGGYGVSVTATASGNSLNVATQQVDISGNSATFSGSGQLSGNILTLSYTISGGGSSESCTMNCTKV